MKMISSVIGSILILTAVSLFAQKDVTKSKELLDQKKPNEALSLLRKYVNQEQINVDACLLAGNAYLALNKPDSAKICADRVLKFDDRLVAGYILSSDALAGEKNFTEALLTVERGLKRTKNDFNLLLHHGYLLLSADSTEQAVVVFSQAMDLQPNNPMVYRGLADAYTKMGAEAMVGIQLEKALQLDSTQTDLAYRLAKIHLNQKRYNESAKVYLRILSLDPTNTVAAWELGQLYFAAKQYSNAAKILGDLAKLQPENKEVWSLYLESLIKISQYADAKNTAEHVLAMDSTGART